MNNGKLQAKQEKLRSLHCPSPQSSLFNSRGTALSSQSSAFCPHHSTQSLSLNPHGSAISTQSPDLGPHHSAQSPSFSPEHSKDSATRCPRHSSECVTRRLQHNDELATRSPQHLFIDVSTELLRQGQSVRFRAPGLSMHPAIKEGETIKVVPISSFDIKRGDILLYLVERKVVAHRVVSIKREKNDSTSHSSAYSSIQASTPSLTHSSTHSSTQASTHSKALNPQLTFILRGDASAICDDPVQAQQILGKVVSVEKDGRSIDLYSRRARISRIAYVLTSRFKRLILSILNKLGEICNEYDTLQ